METVLESGSEDRVRGEEDDDGRETTKLEETLSDLPPRKKAEDCPESYRVNSPDEVRVLAIAESFQRQYSYLYPDRKPLLLCPVNECGVKFVSTSLRPTPNVYPELYTWEGCASFVANFLSLDPLEPPVDPPCHLLSSTSVLRRQRATCFESATLLCSLLLGADYNAYCVSGYAVREMCLLDQSQQECPLLAEEEGRSVISEQEPQDNKYTVRPPMELDSRFLAQQEKKKQEAEAALLLKQKLQEQSEQRPADDPLRGLRVHCWVLVLSGSWSVQENFFIDPLTGKSYTTKDDNFLGVESAWNNLNYYVNLQECNNSCKDMVFDLEDLKTWEPLLYGAVSKNQLILEASEGNEEMTVSKVNDDKEEERPRVLRMPTSWVGPISISQRDLETRYPEGQRVTRYRRAKLERFAPWISEGLVTRLTTYKDLDCTEVVMVKEWYQHRKDHLEQREVNKVDNVTTERFKDGRSFKLLFHRYTSLSKDSQHDMKFSSTRVDGLVRRVDSPFDMTEMFEGRSDFLYYRHAVFKTRNALPRPDVDNHQVEELIRKLVEHFHRNTSKPANEDVAVRVFTVGFQCRIDLTYHLEDYQFSPSKRTFILPREPTERRKGEGFTPDMVSSFQEDPTEKPLHTLALHKMMVDLMKEKEEVSLQIKESICETKAIVECRRQEEKHVQLYYSPWTTTGAAEARRRRQEMERQALEEQKWLQEMETDIMAPFLIGQNNTMNLTGAEAKRFYQDSLDKYKEKLVNQVTFIHSRFITETNNLQKKQEWYQKNQLNMTAQQEEEYQTYCAEKMLQIQVAKKRLSMHKEAAPKKIDDFIQKLRADPRLKPHLPPL
ncbi:dynein regulatory complex subunit 7 isoform X3 [Larimichthys crocea]|uniref:dynein regulatory complex subunit 7 isoform X3 n=1 Tax=Larimichthys crocea TaxID=215358 RepID=UPI000F5FDDDC|nr:dynein regulatory complex subunit 7 isoform X3 [Larimichthys crocea]